MGDPLSEPDCVVARDLSPGCSLRDAGRELERETAALPSITAALRMSSALAGRSRRM